MARPKVAVLCSGEGTTAEAVIKTWANDAKAPMVNLVICNNPDAGIFKRLIGLNKDYELVIEATVINSQTHPGNAKKGEQTAAEEEAILNKILAGNFNLVWLAGYMKKIGPKLVHQFGWRPEYKSIYLAMMLNTHPGLLPETIGYMGVHVQELVLKNKLQAGHSLHVVSEKYDEGPIVTEHNVQIESNDTPETLFERVKASERKNLPGDIANFIKKRKQYLGGRR
ncbi:hypothetical protein A3F65_02070 [Candidatus Saccharibacteria bacterium RIFCSPHIGHO2_12_FULL_47_16b]|nr:MAG: hypothetical protein A3F65_02070 [Candidatus Saccharibacteria bacterium RIFCSPHIGHO2_12_FULL_47_16b]